MKIIEGAKVFLLVYYDPDQDMEICDCFASREKAIAEKRSRNKGMGEECFDENGDFNYDHYDTCDYGYYDIIELNISL